MRRPVLIAVLPVLLLLFTACAATGPARVTPRSLPLDAPAALAGTVGVATLAAPAEDDDPHAPGALAYAATVPENALWWPWKIVGGTGKGLVDGVVAGFGPERLPILGLVFSPVNAAVGTVTGLVTGTLSQPGWIGPREDFGKTMALPMKRPTPIWWLPN